MATFVSSCDLSTGPTSFFGSDFLCQRCTPVPLFQGAFQIKTDVEIHAAAAAVPRIDHGPCVYQECSTTAPSEAPLGANGAGGAGRNCPPSRLQLRLSSANPTPLLTANSEQPCGAKGFHCRHVATQGPLHATSGTSSSSAAAGLLSYRTMNDAQRKLRNGVPQLFSSLRNPSNYSCLASSLCKGSRVQHCGHRSSLSILIFRSFVS